MFLGFLIISISSNDLKANFFVRISVEQSSIIKILRLPNTLSLKVSILFNTLLIEL